MDIREQDLPGVGKKYELTIESGERITVVIENSGRRELMCVRKGADAPAFVLLLSEVEACNLGAILAGAMFQPPT